MNIFSLLPRSFTVEAGGVATGGGHASSGEPELLGEGILSDPRKDFEELLSQGFLQEGDQQSPSGAQGKNLQGELVEDLKTLKGSKVLESLEEIFSSEEALEILGISSNLPFFEGSSLMFLREVALQYLQPSEGGGQSQGEEAILPQGENCKTEAELMALLATLDRKGSAPPEPLSSEQGLLVQEPSESLPQGQNEKTRQELMALLSGLDRKTVSSQQNDPASELSGEMTEEELLLPVSEMPEEKTFEESPLSGKMLKEAVSQKSVLPGEALPESPLKRGLERAAEKNSFPKSGEEGLSLKTEKSAGEIPLFGELPEEEGAPQLLPRAPEKAPEALLPKEGNPLKGPLILQETGEQLSKGIPGEEAVQNSGVLPLLTERGGALSDRGGAGSPESPQASSEGLPRVLPVEEGGESSGGRNFQDSQKFLLSSKSGESRESLSLRDAGEKPSFGQHLESRVGGEPLAPTSQPSRGAETSAPSGSYTLPQRGLPSLGEGVAATVRMVRTFQGSRAQIIVDPPALGRVSISLQSTDQGMSAVLRVDNEGLRQLLQSQMELLRSSLQQQGVTVTSLSVDVRQGGGAGLFRRKSSGGSGLPKASRSHIGEL